MSMDRSSGDFSLQPPFVHEGCHTQKKGVAPNRAPFMGEIQTEKSEIRTGRRVNYPAFHKA
jgi:hypothetical protein